MRSLYLTALFVAFLCNSGQAVEDAKQELPVPVPPDATENASLEAEPTEHVETPREAKLRKLFEDFGFQLDPEKAAVAQFNTANEQPVDPVGLKITSVVPFKMNSDRTKSIVGPRTKIRSREKLIATLQTSHCMSAYLLSFEVELPDGKPSTIAFMRLDELRRQQEETVDVDIPFGFVGDKRPGNFVPKDTSPKPSLR